MQNNAHTSRGSIVLGMVLGMGMLGLAIASTSLLFSVVTVKSSGESTSGLATLVMADAAAREGVYQVLRADDFSVGSVPAFNGVDWTDIEVSGDWPIKYVRGSAANVLSERRVVSTINLFPSGMAFDHALFSSNNIEFGGGAPPGAIKNGNLYAQGNIDFSNAAAVIEGDVTASGEVTGNTSNVNGSIDQNVQIILPPHIDPTPYIAEATAHSNLSEALNCVAQNPGEATIYVSTTNPANPCGGNQGNQGNQGNNPNTNQADFTGTLIYEGNLTLQGGEYTMGTDHLLVLYVDGNLELFGGATVNGLVYVTGDVYLSGNSTVNGAIITTGTDSVITVEGAADINIDEVFTDSIKEQWEEILGLDTTSGTAPMVTAWREE